MDMCRSTSRLNDRVPVIVSAQEKRSGNMLSVMESRQFSETETFANTQVSRHETSQDIRD